MQRSRAVSTKSQVSRRRSQVSDSARRAVEELEHRFLMAAHVAGNATNYATIQAAVDAAPSGGTVTVDAGSYTETVTIAKPLTLRGAQAGVDARSNTRINGAVSESIITGVVSGSSRLASFLINASNVTLDGFVVEGETSQSTANGAGIVIGPNRAGTSILNNIVQNNVAGLFLANNSATSPAVIQQNVFRNNNNAGVNGGRGIYTDGSIAGTILQNIAIDSNAFVNNRGSSGTTSLEAAIAFEAQTAGKQTNIRVTNNTFDSNGKATLFFHTTNVLIDGNAVTNTLDKYSGSLRFEGDDQNVTITHNTLYNNTGPAVAVDSKGVPGDSSGFVVTNNNIYGNSTGWSGSHIGVIYNGDQYDGAFDARNNYWGAANGPGGDGAGSGDWVYGIGHVNPGGQWSFSKGGTETFSPWSTTLIGSGRMAYWGDPADGNGIAIQAEDYDHGGEGVAFHDTTSGNAGGKYRTSAGVDLESSTDVGGGYDLYNTVSGEWVGYTVNIGQTGTYRADFRVAAAAAGATFHLEIDGRNVSGPITVPNTGGSQKWVTVSAAGMNLTAGTYLGRLVFDGNNTAGNAGSYNWFSLNLTSAAATPAAPSNLTAAVASGASTVNLAWQDNSTNETGFKIERQTGTTGNWTVIATAPAGASSYADTSAAAGTTYTYRVRATNASGDSAASNTATATTGALAAAPTSLQAAAASATQVGLVWSDGSAGVSTGIKIERSDDGGATFTQIGTTAAGVSSYTDNTVAANKTYIYRVRATSPGGDSAYSGTATATTPAANAVNTYVSDLNWASGLAGWGVIQKDESVAGNPLKIRGVTYAKGIGTHAVSQIVYNLNGAYSTFLATVGVDDEVKGNGSVVFQLIGDGKTLYSSGVVTGSSAAVNVSVSVAGVQQLTLVATNGVTGSIDFDHADWANARLLASPQAPSAPLNLAAAAVSASQINLTWTAPAAGGAVATYHVERSSDGVRFAEIGTTAASVTTYADKTGLAAATSYSYRVRAENDAGLSGYSAIATATTLQATATSTYLSDLAWTSATAGFGTVQNDANLVGGTISVGGTTYAKGIGTHADSQIVYNLAGGYSRFLSDIGLDDRVATRGAMVQFQVIGDGKVLYDSGVIGSGPAISVDLDVSGVQQLTLIVKAGIAGTIDYDHADWAGARLIG